jgi:probable F420-dependent oxidoreductase
MTRRAMALPFWLDRPPSEALDLAHMAEEHRVDELWIGEMATFDAFALAGAIAATTSHPTLTIGPLAVSLRDPVAFAMGVSSIAELGDRPAHLALGASSPAVVEQWHGSHTRSSTQRFIDVIDVCRSLFRGERTNVDAPTLRSHGFRLRMGRPGSTIAVAAFGPRMVEMAAVHADRVVLAHVTPEQIRRIRTAVEIASDEAQRACPEIVVWTQTGIGDAALEQVRRGLVSYVAAPGYGEMFTAAGFGEFVNQARSGLSTRDLVASLPRGLARSVAAVGEVADVDAAIAARYQAGADLVVAVPATETEGGTLRLLREIWAP